MSSLGYKGQMVVALTFLLFIHHFILAEMQPYFNEYVDPIENDIMAERSSGTDVLDDYYDTVESHGNMGELPDIAEGQRSEVGKPEVIDPSLPSAYVEWCENGRRKRVLPNHCTEIIFAPPFPSCVCFEGIISIQMDESRDCEKRVRFGHGVCLKLDSFGHGVKSFGFVRGSTFNSSDFMLITGKGKGDAKWKLTCVTGNSIIEAAGHVYLLNGQLFQDTEGNNCIQKLVSESTASVHIYKNVFGNFSANQDGGQCLGAAISDSRFVEKVLLDGPGSQCSLACTTDPNQTDITKHHRYIPIPEERMAETSESCRPIPASLKSLHDDLNARILKRSIENAFMDADKPEEFKPQRSFSLLKQMAQITGKVCQKAGIDEMLLVNAVDFLQVAHEGRGYYFHEDFSKPDFEHISKVLNNCLEDTWPMRFRCDSCGGEVKDVFNVSSYRTITLAKDQEYFDHHVVLDIPWAIVNLVNVVCVDYFHHSYRMYHLLEQGMEKLFTKELRMFWLYPEYPRNLYERLFGPYWSLYVKNLNLCVASAYLTSDKRMYPLDRPTWLPGTAMRTRAQKVCRRRRTHESSKVLSTVFEIYCDVLQCQ